MLSDFYFGDGDAEGLKELTTELGDIDARKISTFGIGDLDSGLSVRVGRYGTIVEQAPEGDGEGKRAAVPDDLPPDELTVEKAKELLARPMGRSGSWVCIPTPTARSWPAVDASAPMSPRCWPRMRRRGPNRAPVRCSARWTSTPST